MSDDIDLLEIFYAAQEALVELVQIIKTGDISVDIEELIPPVEVLTEQWPMLDAATLRESVLDVLQGNTCILKKL